MLIVEVSRKNIDKQNYVFEKEESRHLISFTHFLFSKKVHKKKIITFVVTIDIFSKDCHPTRFFQYNVQSGTGCK